MRSPEVRAEQAQRLLSDELLKEAFAQVQAGIVAKLAIPDTAPEKVLEHHYSLVALGRVKRWLEQVVVTGNMEAMQKKR